MTAKNNTKPPTIVVRKMPVVLNSNYKVFTNKIVSDVEVQNLIYKDDIIYEGNWNFINERTKILLFNRSHRLKNTSRTIVKIYVDNAVVEKTSDNVTNLIGQSNYDTVFSALCSVISQELRIKGILALLTVLKESMNSSCQTENECSQRDKKYSEASTQTDDRYVTNKKKVRVKRQTLMPYIVKDAELNVKKIRKVIIDPFKLQTEIDAKRGTTTVQDCQGENNENYIVPDIQENGDILLQESDIKRDLDEVSPTSNCDPIYVQSEQIDISEESHLMEVSNKTIFAYEENSNGSLGNISSLSFTTNNSAFNDLSLLNNVDEHMLHIDEGYTLNIGDYSLKLRVKPEDNFHLAIEKNLKYLTPIEQQKLLLYQACIDFKNCLNRDEDGNMPLHIAVMNNDIELLKRHCAMLKIKKQSVDIPASGNYTALKMAILKDFPSCASILLRMGADPLQVDEDHRTPLHYAAEGSRGCIEALLKFCGENARRILEDNSDLWKSSYDTKSDDQLANYVLDSMCSLCDDQGYTPLMLASQLGNFENAKLLIEAGPNAVNQRMPTSGNTALYLTIAAACVDANNRGNKTKLADKYQMTIELLLENDADPSIENHSSGSVDLLLTELNISELSLLIANKVTSLRYFQGKTLNSKFDSIMLVKNEIGDVAVIDLDSEKIRKNIENRQVKVTRRHKVLKTPTAKKTIKSNIPLSKIQTVTKQNANEKLPVTINNVQTVSGVQIPNVANKKSNNIKIIENVPIKIENNILNSAIQKLPTSSRYLIVNAIDKNVDSVPISNTISLDNIKTSPVKITNSKDIKIVNNSKVCYTIDNLNLKIPILNTLPQIQISNANVRIARGKTKPIQTTNTAKTLDIQKDEGILSKNNNPIVIEPVIIESSEKSQVVNQKPDFVDTFKNFINQDKQPVKKNERKRRNDGVVVGKSVRIKKIEKE